jgi:hypothetical protein
MIRGINPLVTISALVVATPTHAEWVKVGSAVTKSVWYVDSDRVKSVNDTKQAWVKVDHSQDKSVSWRQTMSLWSFKCNEQKYRVLTTVRYDSYGKVISSHNSPEYSYGSNFDPIIPDSIAEAVFISVCVVI